MHPDAMALEGQLLMAVAACLTVAAAGLLEHRWQTGDKAALEAYREGVAAPPTLRWLDEEQSLKDHVAPFYKEIVTSVSFHQALLHLPPKRAASYESFPGLPGAPCTFRCGLSRA